MRIYRALFLINRSLRYERHTIKGKKTAETLGDKALFVKHDVSKRDQWEHVVKTTEDKFGPIQILVNNAGIVIQKPMEEQTDEFFHRTYDINQFGVYLGMLCVYDSMKKVGKGSIINVSSTSGFRGKAGLMGSNA